LRIIAKAWPDDKVVINACCALDRVEGHAKWRDRTSAQRRQPVSRHEFCRFSSIGIFAGVVSISSR